MKSTLARPPFMIAAHVGFAATIVGVLAFALMPQGHSVLIENDKLNHILAFATLTVLACATHVSIGTVVASLLAAAIGIEALQALPVIAREASWLDAAASIAGIGVGGCLLLSVHLVRNRWNPPKLSRFR